MLARLDGVAVWCPPPSAAAHSPTPCWAIRTQPHTMVLLCKCGSADVVEPKLTGGRAPVPELMESAAPEDDGEEVKVEKKKRKSLVKRAYEGAKQCRRIGAYVGSEPPEPT